MKGCIQNPITCIHYKSPMLPHKKKVKKKMKPIEYDINFKISLVS